MTAPAAKNTPAANSPKNTPLKPSNARFDRMYGAYGLCWDGNVLRCRRRALMSIEPDATFPWMWRVRLPTGRLTDMLNLSRAKDYACATALRVFELEVLPVRRSNGGPENDRKANR